MITKKEPSQNYFLHSLNGKKHSSTNANSSIKLPGRMRKFSDLLMVNHLQKSTNKYLSNEYDLLKKRVKELEKTVHHSQESQSLSTPSSKVYPKSNRLPKGSRPRGAPVGHRGASLKIPEKVDGEVIHSPAACPICSNDQLGKESEGWTQTVFDIQPIPMQVKNHVFKRRWCSCCKKKVSAHTSDTLPHRNYGPNVTTMVGHFETLGIPLPKIQLIIKTFSGHEISIPTLMDLANLFGKSIEPEYKKLLQEVKSASTVYADETGFRLHKQ